jgi:hypothetical protein
VYEGAVPRWPALPLNEWRRTRDTLQLWTQIIGKIRMVNTPLLNHWWNVPLYVSARGLTSSLIPHPGGESFQMDLNFHEQTLDVIAISGAHGSLPLQSGSIAGFYAEVMELLDKLGLTTAIWPMPVEIEGSISMLDDKEHRSYDPDQAHRFWLALASMTNVFEEFRHGFVGKSSPVHLFWGGLDLATTRFSGRTAPPHPSGAPNCGPHVMREAYSHEVSSCGYWPGGDGEGFFYAYAYPIPEGYRDQPVAPDDAAWSDELGEFLLPYESVRAADDPDDVVLGFIQSTYVAAATTADWDRQALERHD